MQNFNISFKKTLSKSITSEEKYEPIESIIADFINEHNSDFYGLSYYDFTQSKIDDLTLKLSKLVMDNIIWDIIEITNLKVGIQKEKSIIIVDIIEIEATLTSQSYICLNISDDNYTCTLREGEKIVKIPTSKEAIFNSYN